MCYENRTFNLLTTLRIPYGYLSLDSRQLWVTDQVEGGGFRMADQLLQGEFIARLGRGRGTILHSNGKNSRRRLQFRVKIIGLQWRVAFKRELNFIGCVAVEP
jgi:hypothetical protein